MKSSLRRIFFFVIVPAILLGFLYVFTSTIVDDRAEATNDAFQYTKHGGGTVDGMPFSGVDRGVNPDYIYYNDASEAGQYAAGECTMCHEPHASFGGVEPEPSVGSFQDPDGGPNPYLGLAGADQNFCWYCHENINFDPMYWGGTGFWKFYQGQAIYEASSHFISNNMKSPGYGASQPWPRTDRTSNILSGHCLNCHTPHGIMETPGSEYDTTAVPTSPTNYHLAANNASVSQDYLIPRQLIAWEEALCQNCHDSDGPARTDIKSALARRFSGGSGHPVQDTAMAGKHTASEDVLNLSRHVECYDCHNPHAATGDGSGGTIGTSDFNRLAGQSFIQCDGSDCSGIETSPGSLGRDPYVHEVCLRCHGDSYDCVMSYRAEGASLGTEGCTPLATRHRGNESSSGVNLQLGNSNKRVEFDPATIMGTEHGADATKVNSSFHPVAVPGRNTSIQLCNQLKTAFSLSCANQATADAELSNLTISCIDCHNDNEMGGLSVRGPIAQSNLRTTDVYPVNTTSDVVGPHGSDNPRILRSPYSTVVGETAFSWGSRGSIAVADRLCFRCHQKEAITDADYNSEGELWTNFWASGSGMMGMSWGASLHQYHLTLDLSPPITCHECHNNVHSNVEANNTQYYQGGACCTGWPADGNTHLLNFASSISESSYLKPAWYYDAASAVFRCNLTCHNQTMNTCSYKGAYDGGPAGGGWC